MGGTEHHRQTNPLGVTFEFGTFAQAHGCSATGPAVAEHSWFAGYQWRVALCAGCQTHLGWWFGNGHDTFYGLITARMECLRYDSLH